MFNEMILNTIDHFTFQYKQMHTVHLESTKRLGKHWLSFAGVVVCGPTTASVGLSAFCVLCTLLSLADQVLGKNFFHACVFQTPPIRRHHWAHSARSLVITFIDNMLGSCHIYLTFIHAVHPQNRLNPVWHDLRLQVRFFFFTCLYYVLYFKGIENCSWRKHTIITCSQCIMYIWSVDDIVDEI